MNAGGAWLGAWAGRLCARHAPPRRDLTARGTPPHLPTDSAQPSLSPPNALCIPDCTRLDSAQLNVDGRLVVAALFRAS
jgi:hypothetical protein